MSDTELDLDESMAETLSEINGRDDDTHESEAEGDSAEEQDAGDEVVAEVEESGDDSDDDGEITGESEGDTGDNTDTEEDELSVEDEDTTDDLGTPPTAYSAAAKDDWAKTPKSVREAAIKREEDSSKGVQMIKEKADFGTRLSDAASPYMAMIQSKGATLESFIVGQGNTMHGLQHGTQDQKIGILRGMAGLAGIDIANIQPPSEIERQLQPYMSEINTLKQQINQQNQQTTSQQDFAINQALNAFETETDENGLTHPYFHNVENEMVAIIPSIKQQNPHFSNAEVLQQAYDNSIWANPETRQQIQVQQDKKAETERKRKAKEAAAKAKRANKVNLPKKGQPASSQADTLGTLDDTMAETMRNIKNR
jgi:hypothetical protein